jgi:NADH/NAD ratio-sensing transcriptional regulator Rex
MGERVPPSKSFRKTTVKMAMAAVPERRAQNAVQELKNAKRLPKAAPM